MKTIAVISRIRARAGSLDAVRQELLKLISPTREEKGCLSCDLHQDLHDPATFFFYETWESLQALEDHLNSSHISAYLRATEGMVEDWEIHRLARVDVP